MVGRVFVALAIRFIGDTYLHGVKRVEDIELGYRNLAERIESHSLTQQNRVEPAATTAPTGVGPVLVAAVDHQVSRLVAVLGRERSGADTGDVGLRDPDHRPDLSRA